MLRESGLTREDAKRMRCEPFTADSMTKQLPGLTTYIGAGFTIPYLTPEGKPTRFFRYRYVEEVGRDGFAALTRNKPMRYVQPAGVLPTVYWAPLSPWEKILANKEEPLFITEGEKKAACGCKHLFATIGLGGVWSFKSKDNNVAFIAELESVDWKERRVYIVYDSDALQNRKILQAESELARQLLERGALVFVVRLDDDLETGKKVGLDDFIVANGRDAFQKIVDEEAEPFINSQALHALNDKVTLILHPTAVWDNDNRRLIAPNAFIQTTHHHLKHTVIEYVTIKGVEQTKQVEKRTAKEWMGWGGRSVANSLVYEPGAGDYAMDERGKRAINLWEGWGREPKKGDIAPWTKLFDFLTDGATAEDKRWLEQWLAYPIQYPGTKLFSAVVMWSVAQGTGKTLMGHIMKEIYGNNYEEIGMNELYAAFNAWAVNKQFIMGEEIAGGENKRILSDRLKKLITQPSILVNTKYIPQYTIRDCVNYYFTSNHPNAFYLEDTDRRFFVQEVRNPPMSAGDYKEIDEWKKSDGPSALLYHLLHVDLSGFNPKGAPPVTESKEEMRQESKSEVGRWVVALRTDPAGILKCAGAPLAWTLATGTDLYHIYDPEGRRNQLLPLSHELRRSNYPRANGGNPLKISGQAHRLWITATGAERDRLARATPKQLAEIYLKEHGDGSRKF